MHNDKIQLLDGLHLRDNIAHPSRGFYDTEITISSINEDGSITIKQTKNKTALMGRTNLIENSFDIPITAKRLFLNDNLTTVQGSITPLTFCTTPETNRPRSNKLAFQRRRIKWFCAGDGAENPTVPYTSFDARDTDTRLFNIIPFRLVPTGTPLSAAERRQYRGAVTITAPNSSTYTGYFFKKIEYPSGANGVTMTVDNVDYTPAWNDTIANIDSDPNNPFFGNKVQQSYLDFNIKINNREFKEYYEVFFGSLINARFSEIGLVSGLDCHAVAGINNILDDLPAISEADELSAEVWDAELFSHLTFEPYPVSRPNSQIEFLYRIFA